MKNKMKKKKTDKVYRVKTTPLVEDNILLLRVPKGVEINEEILSKDPILNPRCRFEISEVKDKKLWIDEDIPSLDKDGNIHYEGCDWDDLDDWKK